MQLFNAMFSVEALPPEDPFNVAEKSVPDLLLFDAKASIFQSVKVSGQIVHVREGTYYLMDGTNGLRFIPKEPIQLKLGDHVQVVGFPDLNGLSLVLREALVRKTGQSSLPAARSFDELSPLSREYDSTLVRTESRLVSIHSNQSDLVMELQAGARIYIARLSTHNGLWNPIPIGSRVRITGVYSGLGGDRNIEQGQGTFELLLNSPSDIDILKRPDWWDVKRALWVTGLLLSGLLIAGAWILMITRSNAVLKKTQARLEEKANLLLREMEDRQRLEVQLRQAQKMEIVGQLAGGIAHDFNNILLAILLHLELLQNDPAATPELREELKELEKEANRAAALTRQLLLFSRRQIMSMKALDLKDVLANLSKMLRRLLGEHIHVTLQLGDAPLWVKGDEGMIEQVIVNLCVNARDAMPKGGNLIIGAQLVVVDDETAFVNPEAHAGKFACIYVTDSGFGISEEVLKRIFEPFFTTKDVGKGTGLGLATAYGIVKQHLGWLEVTSVVGKGSTFRVFIPIRES